MTIGFPDLVPVDFTRDYEPTSDLAIPEPGICWVARGLMVETCARLLGRPMSLELYALGHLAVISLRVAVFGEPVLFVDLTIGTDSGRWSLVVDDRVVDAGWHVPSPRQLADLVLDDHDTRHSPTIDETGEQPTHLW